MLASREHLALCAHSIEVADVVGKGQRTNMTMQASRVRLSAMDKHLPLRVSEAR
jgi:hypothetical protein